ncbi:MAG: 50S ribosomal protein L25 [Marvinbryantia sp.]|uniref:50S ribosomal protein L25 n=1 Tax=Marvinbryantia sp. TaxID=2496532 RepID=UPI00266F4BC3|nr:50S ribosomal protein L25 [uncultured Marvinbryantia sp.]
MNTLKAERRSLDTKAKKLRREGFVTGNVFGKELKETIPVKIEKKDAERLLKTCNKGSQIMLEVEGKKLDVLIKEIDYNSMKRQIDEIDFQALVSGEEVHSVAEVVLLNHDKVVNGLIQLKLHEIAYKAVPEALVDKVEINMENMKIGDSVLVKDLELASNEKIHLMTDPEATVVAVTEIHNKAAEADTEEAAAEE